MEMIEYKAMREAIQRIRQLHQYDINADWCSCCLEPYPCQTIQVLDSKQ